MRRLKPEQERIEEGGRAPTWVRNEHLERYRFAAERSNEAIVVDCACGDGSCADLLSPSASWIHGFDLSAAAVETAQRRALPNTTFAIADAGDLPLPDDSADVYVALETIEHLDDAEGFLREAARVLKRGGTLICSTPDRDVYSPGSAPGDTPWNRFHVREYTQPEFVSLLEGFFAQITLFGQNAKSPALTRLRGLAGRRLSRHLVVRATQVTKLPRFLYDKPAHHRVVPAEPGRRYEYLVAVCRGS
jgi:SAM-dependent methyltransferase